MHGQPVALQGEGDWQKHSLALPTSISAWYDLQASSTADLLEGGTVGQAHDTFPLASKMP